MFKKSSLFLLLILVSSLGYSQCTSTSGIAIINETFGAGVSAVAPALPAGVTNLQYVNNACPNDGQYSIVNYSSGCFSNAWYTTTDHTGDKNGYYMLINASLQPSDFYVKTINGLCEGTTYQFSSWVLNIDATNPTVLPNITFTIETTGGTVLSTYTTGTIPFDSSGPVWKQYGMMFKTPVGVSTVVIRMHNNGNGGLGNDVALDDISFTPAGPLTTISATGFTGNTVNACATSVNFTSTIGTCYVTTSYQWQQSADGNSWTDIPGATNPNYKISPLSTGTNYYRLSVAENGSIGSATCRVNSNVMTVNNGYTPPVLKNISQTICAGNTYLLPSGKAVSSAGVYLDTVFNTFECPATITTLNLTVKPKASSIANIVICYGDNYLGYTKPGTYTQTLVAANGCDSVITINLTIYNKLTPALGPDKLLCVGDVINLNPGVFSQYLWQDGSTSANYKVSKGGTYWVKVTDNNGCVAADTVVIKPVNCTTPKIPNAFTPNGDGINDTWAIDDLLNFPQAVVSIYSRWGVRLFYSVGYSKPWDGRYGGKDLPAGTYYYLINLNDGTALLSGPVVIIR